MMRCSMPYPHPKADIVGERGSTSDVIQWGPGQRNKNSGTAMREQKIPIDTKNCAPTSRVLQDVMSQVPSEYVTVGWLTSSLHGRSLGTIMLCFGLLAMTPVGSTVPGLILAVMALRLIAGSAEPVFPHLIAARRLPAKQLLGLGSPLFIFCSTLKRPFIRGGR
jgi:Exopolysaccharide synthesis, ExoD